jgi:hypothetical protein
MTKTYNYYTACFDVEGHINAMFIDNECLRLCDQHAANIHETFDIRGNKLTNFTITDIVDEQEDAEAHFATMVKKLSRAMKSQVRLHEVFLDD